MNCLIIRHHIRDCGERQTGKIKIDWRPLLIDNPCMDTRELVAGLIIRDKRLLLVHNVKHDGFRIEPPGGKRHGDETREEAVAREVMEETGLRVDVRGLFGGYSTHSPEGSFNVYMYLCDAPQGEPIVMEPHLMDGLGWYSYEDMEGLAASGALVPNMVAALGEIKMLLARDGAC